MISNFEQEIQGIIAAYEKLVLGIEKEALGSKSRAYGGIIRAGKGALVESIARHLVELAWQNLNIKNHKLEVPSTKKTFRIPIRKEYVEKLENEEIKNYIKQHINDYYYIYQGDVQVYVDNKLAMVIECKAYTENAMLKRVLVDFTLLKVLYPDFIPVLLQLESQLGGDYSELKKVTFGSYSTHTLLSYFNVDLTIITLLKGERRVDRPIHKREFYKPLTKESLENAIKVLGELLRRKII
ncbi:MAG: restriction endonuclease [Nitrososphaeria archaeon]